MRLGIDIGGTNTVWGLVNEQGQILDKGGIKTKAFENFPDYLNALSNSLKPTLEKHEGLKGIGVGAPNANAHTGCIEFAPNLVWGKDIVPLAESCEKEFGLKTFITNDANAAAIGEMRFGAAKGINDFIMVTLGTGVGSGFVVNGQLVYGHDGLAGELGHIIAVRDGRDCGCGRKGCLETYTSATGIVRTAEELLKQNKESLLIGQEPLNGFKIFEAALNDDPLALEIFDFTGKILGQSLADAVAITSPKMIVLFGGLAKSGKFIFDPIQKYFEQNLLKIYQGKVQIVPSQLPENDVAILGAAALVI